MFAGLDPNAEPPDVEELYQAIKRALWEKGVLPVRKKFNKQGSRATDEAYAAAAKKEALDALAKEGLRGQLDIAPGKYRLQVDKATGTLAGCVRIDPSGEQGEHVVLGKRGQSDVTLTVEPGRPAPSVRKPEGARAQELAAASAAAAEKNLSCQRRMR